MRVHIKHWSAVAQWRWNTGNADQDDEGDVCGICRVPYEGCCPSCKMPGDDCPLSEPLPSPPISLCSDLPKKKNVYVWTQRNADEGTVWGECSHIFHMHCLLKWLGTAASKQQCPMDRRPWGVSPFPFRSPLVWVDDVRLPSQSPPNARSRTPMPMPMLMRLVLMPTLMPIQRELTRVHRIERKPSSIRPPYVYLDIASLPPA